MVQSLNVGLSVIQTLRMCVREGPVSQVQIIGLASEFESV